MCISQYGSMGNVFDVQTQDVKQIGLLRYRKYRSCPEL